MEMKGGVDMINPLVGRYSTYPIDFNAERQEYIAELKQDITVYTSLPSYFKDDPLIIKALHEIASDKFEYTSMGFDVLKKEFFANELFHFTDKEGNDCEYHLPHIFTDFGSFFKYVRGKIYEKSCYFGYTFSKEEIKKYKIDLSRLNFTSLVEETIDNLDLSFLPLEPPSVDVDSWHNMVDDLVNELEQTIPSEVYEYFKEKHQHSPFRSKAWVGDVTTPAIIKWVALNPKAAISKIGAIMRESSFPYFFKNGICAIGLLYPNEMLAEMPTHIESGSTRKRNEIRDQLIDALHKGVDIKEEKGYDSALNVFYIKYTVYSLGRLYCTYSLTFSAFEDFVSELSDDLSDCNLRVAPLDGINLSLYKTNSKTILNAKYLNYEPEDIIEKGYWGNSFHIRHCLVDRNGNILANRSYSYRFFFDFLHVLKNDLTGCILADCEGLENVPDLLLYHADRARIPSNVLEKAGMPSIELENVKYEFQRNSTFKLAKENEKLSRSVLSRYTKEPEKTERRVYYISDIHLHNKLRANKSIKTEVEIKKKIEEWVSLLAESQQTIGPMIIAGDICHEKNLCYRFLKLLSHKKKMSSLFPETMNCGT